MSILDDIKKGAANNGSNKGKIIFVKDGDKKRLRFLNDIEHAIKISFHDDYDSGVNIVCQKHLGKKCPNAIHKSESMRTRDGYVFSVWDHDAKEVKLFVGFANNFNPLPQLAAMFESYGTLKDRDYVIKRDGKQTKTSYTVIPMDRASFKNKKAKPYSKDKMLKVLDKAFQDGLDDPDEVEDDDVEDTKDDAAIEEYEDMSPRELYMECIERGLEAKKKKKAAYYIDILVEDDKEDKDDEDDWEEEEDDEEDDDDNDW